MTTWLNDGNGNKCSVEYFGSKEAAQTALDSLKECKNCVNCSGCSHEAKRPHEAARLYQELAAPMLQIGRYRWPQPFNLAWFET